MDFCIDIESIVREAIQKEIAKQFASGNFAALQNTAIETANTVTKSEKQETVVSLPAHIKRPISKAEKLGQTLTTFKRRAWQMYEDTGASNTRYSDKDKRKHYRLTLDEAVSLYGDFKRSAHDGYNVWLVPSLSTQKYPVYFSVRWGCFYMPNAYEETTDK